MAEPTPALSSAFPLPPMNYIDQFSDDNVRLGKAPRPPAPIVVSCSIGKFFI